MTWISCKERLPNDYEVCLISDGKTVSCGHMYYASFWKDYCNLIKIDKKFEPKVKYWMPFPEAPKKKRVFLTNMKSFSDEKKLVDWFKRDYFS